jgi:hypothetical protein
VHELLRAVIAAIRSQGVAGPLRVVDVVAGSATTLAGLRLTHRWRRKAWN